MSGGNVYVGDSASRDLPPPGPHYCVNVAGASAANLSSSFSLEAEEARDTPDPAPRISPGTTSSLRCTVNEFFPRLPKPNLRFRPADNFIIHRHKYKITSKWAAFSQYKYQNKILRNELLRKGQLGVWGLVVRELVKVRDAIRITCGRQLRGRVTLLAHAGPEVVTGFCLQQHLVADWLQLGGYAKSCIAETAILI